MNGRLYTAQEIFEAMTDATAALASEEPPVAYFINKVGADIAYAVAEALGFDIHQLMSYCQKENNKEEE